MIKDKIVELENGVSYYVLDEIIYNNKKYILTIECDLKKDEINENDYFVMELKIDGNDIIFSPITDNKLAMDVTELLIKKVRSNQN